MILISSHSKTRAQGEAFNELVAMGRANPKEIMPLLIQKLMDPAEFFAYNIYEGITKKYSNCALPVHQAHYYAVKWIDTNVGK
jgi:hypothetical protein